MKEKRIICYNLATCPLEVSIDNIFDIADRYNYLFYDSSISKSHNSIPYMQDKGKHTKVLIDVSNDAGSKLLNKMLVKLKKLNK
jgi:hypothetical protein